MNMGTMPHNLAVKGTSLATPMISPGSTTALKLTGLAPGTYEIYCLVPGHEAAGMKATLHITGASTGNTTGAPATVPASGATADAKIDFSATPAPTWHAFDPALGAGARRNGPWRDLPHPRGRARGRAGHRPTGVDVQRAGARPSPAGPYRRPVQRDAR